MSRPCRHGHPRVGRQGFLTRTLFPLALSGLFGMAGCTDQAVFSPDPDRAVEPQRATVPAAAQARQARGGYAPGQILVRFTPGTDGLAVAAQHGATPQREILPDVWLAGVPEGNELRVAEALSRNPNVVYAEPDHVRTLADVLCESCDTPDDEFFKWQWNMHNEGVIDLSPDWDSTLGPFLPTGAPDADIDWLEAFDYLGSPLAGSVKIGILDTGIRPTHEDFCNKEIVWKDFYNPPQAVPFDDQGHGSHVAGTAGACTNNGKGVVGIAYGQDMSFVIGKVCTSDATCLTSAIAPAIHWAVDNGANVINMSFGDVEQSQTEADALVYAVANNVLPVCAAGNEGANVVIFPAADPNCVAVSATDFGDNPASYTSWGAEVELSAPGGDLEDLIYGSSWIQSTGNAYDSHITPNVGTSMASPHVAGLAALLYARGVTDASDIRACLRNTADDLGAAGWDEFYGWGRINMYQAVLNAPSCIGSGGGVNVPPSASFMYGCTDLGCDFTDMSSDSDGSVVGWSLTFGDGATSTEQHPSHTYAAAGTYTVTLTATDNGSMSSAPASHDVTVTAPNQVPTADFSFSPTDLDVGFTDASTDTDGIVESWSWDFGDSNSSSEQNPSHTYAAAGTYNVTLTITDDGGLSDNVTKAVTVTAPTNNTMHVSDLEGWTEDGKGNRWRALMSVTLVDQDGTPVQGAEVNVSWSGATSGAGAQATDASGMVTFNTGNIRGDGFVTFTVNSASSASHTYDSSANTDADGDSDGTSLTVTRGPGNSSPTADFSDSCTDLECSFTDLSSDSDGFLISWDWDFGDGNTSIAEDPPHTYAAEGTYTVSLTVTDDLGASDTATRQITVSDASSGGGAPVLSVTTKTKGQVQATLTWTSGSGGPYWVERSEDGGVFQTIATDLVETSFADKLGRGYTGSITYRVCELAGCSNEVPVTF